MALRDTVCEGCPPLSWRIAQRVCNLHASSDCIISIEGKKGLGKSTLSLQLAEEIAREISKIKTGTKPEDYFDISHIVSIEHEGALELLTSGKLQKMNQVFILDDVQSMWNSRRAMTFVNQSLNDIATICRVYETVLIVNMVTRSSTDLVLRQLTDIIIRMYSRSTITNKSLFKTYLVEHRNNGDELLKYFQWKGPDGQNRRIKWWIGGLPSPGLNAAYKKMRIAATNTHIQEAFDKLQEKRGEAPPKEKKTPEVHPNVIQFTERVGQMFDNRDRVTDIVLETGLSRYWVEKCISAHKARMKAGAV